MEENKKNPKVELISEQDKKTGGFGDLLLGLIDWSERNWLKILFIIIAVVVAGWIIDPYIHPENYSTSDELEPPASWCSGPYCD